VRPAIVPALYAASPILALHDLSVIFGGPGETPTYAIDRVSLSIAAGEVVGIVGESGSGKSVTALCLMGLIGFSSGRIVGGRIEVDGRDMTDAPEQAWRTVRGAVAAMVFQEPMSSLNPLLTVGRQIEEALTRRDGHRSKRWRNEAEELLDSVQIRDPRQRLSQYPHELSGGMRQRVMIAMALAQRPRLLIADEATTALDVTVQKEIVDLLGQLRRDRGLAILFISHDLALVGECCDRIVVMYGGHVVEEGRARSVLALPRHPYSELLLRARPQLAAHGDLNKPAHCRPRLSEIDGAVTAHHAPADRCRFLERCPKAIDRCRAEPPPWVNDDAGRSRCWVAAP
jgi:peptide/nickel transport system ATP-binding protein